MCHNLLTLELAITIIPQHQVMIYANIDIGTLTGHGEERLGEKSI